MTKRCKVCGEKEKSRPAYDGGKITNIAPHLGVCVDCITMAWEAERIAKERDNGQA